MHYMHLDNLGDVVFLPGHRSVMGKMLMILSRNCIVKLLLF